MMEAIKTYALYLAGGGLFALALFVHIQVAKIGPALALVLAVASGGIIGFPKGMTPLFKARRSSAFKPRLSLPMKAPVILPPNC